MKGGFVPVIMTLELEIIVCPSDATLVMGSEDNRIGTISLGSSVEGWKYHHVWSE